MCEREAQCPAPNTINPSTGQCVPPEKLIITLSGSSEVEPSKGSAINTLPFTATVIDQNTNQPPTHPVTVKISLKVEPNSGGHEHGDSSRPRGGIANVGTCSSDATCWSETSPANNGVVVFNFNAPEASGTHTITATCEGCSNNDSKEVAVKVVGLEKIPEIPFLYSIKLPNRDTNHPATYFLTKASAERLKMIALYYYAFTFAKKKQGVVPDFVLNDASLEWGGVLDCFLTCSSAQYPSTPWHKHHVEHRRGSVVDIKANGDPGSVVYDSDFRFWAAEFGVDVGRLHGSGSGLHYHIRLNNNKPE